MTRDHDELDALLRRAAGAEPMPIELEARVRRAVAAERGRLRGRRRAVAALAGLSGVAAAAAVLLQPGPAGPPSPGSPPAGPVAVDASAAEDPAADGATADAAPRRPMLAADPATLDPAVRVLDAGTAAPVVLASNDPDITIVWLLPGAAAGDSTEIPR